MKALQGLCQAKIKILKITRRSDRSELIMNDLIRRRKPNVLSLKLT